ncbi:MAG: glycosyltransferase [Gammaproteobacteria bacterium]|nr:glycosyltransferase [Gammaproteobacteria bacterium]
MPSLEGFEPSQALSVIVSYCEAPDELARTLAALEGQSYPAELFEVIVVDVASDPPLELPSSPLDVKLMRQKGADLELARARNDGARRAKHDILVFVDADLIAERELLAAHARWHHALSDALTMGMSRRVSIGGVSVSMIRGRTSSISSLLGDRESDPSPLAEFVEQTNDLTTKRDDFFRAASEGNLGIRRRFFDEIGGFSDVFSAREGMDTELAYRAYTRGALLVPVPEAMAWRQRRLAEMGERKQRDDEIQLGTLANLIAHRAYRRAAPGRTFGVPEYVVTIRAEGATHERVLDLAEEILGGAIHDLAVRIEMRGWGDDGLPWLASHLERDPRVCLVGAESALDQFPASPFHVIVEAGALVNRDSIARLRQVLGSGVLGALESTPGTQLSITRAWALRRAQRTGLSLEELGDVAVVDVRARVAKTRAWLTRARRILSAAPDGDRKGWPHVRRRAALVRRPRDLVRFLRWLLYGTGARLSEIARGQRREIPSYSRPSSPTPKAPSRPLGVEIVALGARAAQVFAGCPFVSSHSAGGHVDIVVADTPGEAASSKAPAIVLSEAPELAVPAFDPATDNPVDWEKDVSHVVGSLGSRHLLPSGFKAHRVVAHNDVDAVRLCHHLLDVAAFHADAIRRAGLLVRLAATGAPICLTDGGSELEPLIGGELHALMTEGVSEADVRARELHSIKMRRIALREHSFRSRARQLSEVVLDHPPKVPTVSILLATKRPDFLGRATENIARQNYPRLQLVLALHGEGFHPKAVEHVVERLQLPVRVVRVRANQTLGTVLNAAVAEADGTLLTKMDDDDLYGADHIWDLVLAHEYSSAELVGKASENIYLADSDQTIQRRFRSQSEAYSRHVTGGAILISRHDLDLVGGWPRVPSGEDSALVTSVLRNDGRAYRTHSSGYLMIRHGVAHTWEADHSEFLSRAYAVFPGWRPDVAGIEDVPAIPVSFPGTDIG